MAGNPTPHTATGNHFSCSLSAVLLARVHAYGGVEAVGELLRQSGVKRTPDYLLDTGNWISYDEAVALWQAGAKITRHPQFARAVGEEAARRLAGSPVAALLRSLGSPENVYRQIAMTATKFSVVTNLEAEKVGPGFADIVAVAVDGFPRSADHCAWTCGLLTQTTILFGLSPAKVEHEECESLGASCCRYHVTWNAEEEPSEASTAQLSALESQLEAMKERLRSMFATASDLIDADEMDDILARITDRAAQEVRAPRCLLAVQPMEGGPIHRHYKGFDDDEVTDYAERILTEHPASFPESWLVVPVSSKRRDYGRLLAMYESGHKFFPQERELFEVYSRYAATALDGATALMEAKQRFEESSALLHLARALAEAGTSGEVAQRLAEAVPSVVDCDRVGVYLWDPSAGEIVRRATCHRDGVSSDGEPPEWSIAPSSGGPLAELLADPNPEPIFVDGESGHPILRELLAKIDVVSSILVPLATSDSMLGVLVVSVKSRPERLNPNPDLLNRLSGVAAQATTALQNGRLVDQMTHQALHDPLTGLANRSQFVDRLRVAIKTSRDRREVGVVFYIDLDGFKPVNDEFGHDMGDRLLVAVGQRLTACTRATDTVARLGGDEFAVLLDAQSSLADSEAVADRLAQAFDSPFSIDGHELRVGGSIGRAVFPIDADNAEELLRVADAAMYDCKRVRKQSRSHAGRR